MKVIYLTAGGAGMYCGSCKHDNLLASRLQALGVDLQLVPTFTPIRTDDFDVSSAQVLLGGLHLYLQDRWPLLRRLPRWADRWLAHPALLGALSRLTLESRGDDDGRLALELLAGERGGQRRELAAVADWIVAEQPDVLHLSNLLIAGFLPSLHCRWQGKVVASLQGDDLFVDQLPAGYQQPVLTALRVLATEVDTFVVTSQFYRRRMSEWLKVSPGKIEVLPLGIDPTSVTIDRTPREQRSPKQAKQPLRIGYLARIYEPKGFGSLVDAFLRLAARPGFEDLELYAAGWVGKEDEPFVRQQRQRLRDAGLEERVRIEPNVDLAGKRQLLAAVDVLSVPTLYAESKGLYVLEALAAGVPVVMPEHGVFPELLTALGGGRLCCPGDVDSLVAELESLLKDPCSRQQMAEAGRSGVLGSATAEHAAAETLALYRKLVPSSPRVSSPDGPRSSR